MSKKLAVILIRGVHDLDKQRLHTLKLLNLLRKNTCSVVENNAANKGMIFSVKDYVTYGEIDDETLKLLIEKRGIRDKKDPKKIKNYFRLNSPRKGFERKGIKKPFSIGGALGYRGDKINDLIRRMI